MTNTDSTMSDEKLEKAEKPEKAEKKVLVLHQFPRAKNCPSPSPYPLKVETFLRMNKLSYTSGNQSLFGCLKHDVRCLVSKKAEEP